MEREEVWDFFWDENLDVELLSIGEHHVDVLVKDQDKNLKWRGTFVYGGTKSARSTLDVGANANDEK